MSDILQVCEAAWDAAKQPHQPLYADLVESYHYQLRGRAEGVLESGELSGDVEFEAFENKVKELSAKPPAMAAAAIPDFSKPDKNDHEAAVSRLKKLHKLKPAVKKTPVKQAVKKAPTKKAVAKAPVKKATKKK